MLVEPPLSGWPGLALSTPVVWWCGWVFIAGSWYAMKRRKLDMSVLIANRTGGRFSRNGRRCAEARCFAFQRRTGMT
jgi:cation transport ATPase